ncbi:flp pilus assembly protein TadD, partial [Yersinia pestis PY-66]
EGDNSGATTVLHRLLSIAPHNPEAHNLKGIILANRGDTAGARTAIVQSQALFIQEDIARNNIAVISMLDNRYED